ncbi:cytochrome c3 family protein [Microbulbifer sp. SA54]|uniref:cytochrome c3 family protein n=1 Tax=Microbulbifer sp. SA54 TaxID=3401577 RepID=UPI003AAFF6D9
MKNYKFRFWHYGLLVTVVAAALITYNLEASDKTFFLSGEVTHGHHQVELACTTCHGEGFSGQEGIQQACVSCHGDELTEADDSHPRSKFLDPRNAGLLERLDARYCVACHTEHKPEITHAMGVTQAGDFCIHCHSDIADNRPNHSEFAFDSCASAGCHNYHDNRFLYEDFLAGRLNVPDMLTDSQLPVRTLVSHWQAAHPERSPLKMEDADLAVTAIAPEALIELQQDWAASAHAQTDTNCSDCHTGNQINFSSSEIVTLCGDCHANQRDRFTEGKHGFRFSSRLPEQFRHESGAISPLEAKTAMKESAGGELNCVSCHGAHSTDVRYAAVEACISCHDDEHSRNYFTSAHYQAWQETSDVGVSCATCHLPREVSNGETIVNHNQNHNLRPVEKMLPVCLSCHGIEFAMAALADKEQHLNNFNAGVQKGHTTFQMIRERIARIKTSE